MTTDLTQNARFLKAVVIGLGVLILVAVGLIAYKVVAIAMGGADELTTATAAVPVGSRVISMTEEDDHLSLLIEDGAGRQRVMTIDRKSGAVIGILTLESEQ